MSKTSNLKPEPSLNSVRHLALQITISNLEMVYSLLNLMMLVIIDKVLILLLLSLISTS